jgi:hypothetical protein
MTVCEFSQGEDDIRKVCYTQFTNLKTGGIREGFPP